MNKGDKAKKNNSDGKALTAHCKKVENNA